MIHNQHLYTFLFALLFSITLWGEPSIYAQVPDRSFMRGLAVQGYPAGVILNGRFSYFYKPNQSVGIYLGYNITNRRDWGEHDNEQGSGAGVGLAWRYYFKEKDVNGFHAGIRTDMWFLTIDWEQDTGQEGETEISVLQPTAQFGYSFFPADRRVAFELNASLGAEINILTRGEDVGEGAIFLVGFSFGYQF